MKLYKYIPSKYLDDFTSKGLVLFRSLSYFKNFEDNQIRGDQFEGVKKYEPTEGLLINNLTTGKTFKLNKSFESNVKSSDIFVFCMSSELNKEMCIRFDADVCIEFIDQKEFINKIVKSLNSFKDAKIVHDFINYYNFNDPPIVDWAMPDKIVLSKPDYFKWQKEYRIAFGLNGAFNLENTELFLKQGNPLDLRKPEINSEHYLEIGSLDKIIKIHKCSEI